MALADAAFMEAIITTAAIHKLATQPNSPKKDTLIELILRKGMSIIPSIVENLKAPSTKNAVMLTACTLLLTIWAFGSINLPPEANLFSTPEFAAQAPSPQDLLSPRTPRLNELLTVIQLSAGTYAIIMTVRDEIYENGFEDMIQGSPWATMEPPPQNVIYGLNGLEAHCRSIADEMPRELAEEYVVQIQRLYNIFQASLVPSEHDNVVGFAVRFPKIIIREIAERKPLALTMLAYWTAALQAVDRIWWVHGWPRAVFDEISEVLDADWKAHLNVPAKYFDK